MPTKAQIKARKAFVKKYAKKGKRGKSTKGKSKVPKEYQDSSGKTRWQLAKIKFKGDRAGLLQYYYNIPYKMRSKYGAPKSMN